VTSDLDWLEGREVWTDLRSVVLIASERYLGDSLSVARRSYLSSLGNDARLWKRRSADIGVWSIRCPGSWT
jgi:hypothetical protein